MSRREIREHGPDEFFQIVVGSPYSGVIGLDHYWTGWYPDGIWMDWIEVAVAIGWIGSLLQYPVGSNSPKR